jgi:peptidoglycan L-alanyl-D-glutamate endopeptidase CwlK
MSRLLNGLSPRFRPLAFELLARLTEAKIPVLITCTSRTAAEQAEAVATGHSAVAHSKHQDGDAIDIIPFSQFLLYGEDKLQWDAVDPVWMKIGQIGEALGLRWGGRFKPLNTVGVGWDPGHFEYPDKPPAPSGTVQT